MIKTGMMLALSALVMPIAAPVAGRSPAPIASAGFQRNLGAFIARLRDDANAPPGTAVIVVHRGETVFEAAYGVRDSRDGAPLTLDAPMYNASVTKAYTGVLAAVLDADGTLPLSASLTDVWPALGLPAPLDATTITAERLLSHLSGIRAGGLMFRSVFTGDIDAQRVPDHLARYAAVGREGFDYQNLGPFIWSAMAEARTGLPWRDLLRRRVLGPLGLRHSAGRLEAFAPGSIARCHARVGGAWRSDAPKPTVLMNAAGGMFTSPRDAAAFLNAMITDGVSAGGAIPAAVLRRSWQPASAQDREIWGMRRDGYGLGWDLGSIDGRRFVSRSGGYVGCRAISLFLPELQLGIVVMSNGDAGVNDYHAAIASQAIDEWTRAPRAAAQAEQRLMQVRTAMAAAIAEADTADSRLSNAAPIDPADWRGALGHYRNERLGDFDLVPDGRGLRLIGGAFSGALHHLGGDSFLIQVELDTGTDDLEMVRDEAGRIVALMWDDDRYERVMR
jgi:CubicO group peptidase (beta-lactamase class C family)